MSVNQIAESFMLIWKANYSVWKRLRFLSLFYLQTWEWSWILSHMSGLLKLYMQNAEILYVTHTQTDTKFVHSYCTIYLHFQTFTNISVCINIEQI
jgi:hypothetical protein